MFGFLITLCPGHIKGTDLLIEDTAIKIRGMLTLPPSIQNKLKKTFWLPSSWISFIFQLHFMQFNGTHILVKGLSKYPLRNVIIRTDSPALRPDSWPSLCWEIRADRTPLSSSHKLPLLTSVPAQRNVENATLLP